MTLQVLDEFRGCAVDAAFVNTGVKFSAQIRQLTWLGEETSIDNYRLIFLSRVQRTF